MRPLGIRRTMSIDRASSAYSSSLTVTDGVIVEVDHGASQLLVDLDLGLIVRDLLRQMGICEGGHRLLEVAVSG